jgi:hypothetical protein
MLALLLTLIVTPATDLSGTWLAEDGCQFVIVGRSMTVTDAEGFSFTSRLTVLPSRLRMVDAVSVLELGYRIDGERLTLGVVEYRRAGIAAARKKTD